MIEMIKNWLKDIKDERPLWLAECRQEALEAKDTVKSTISVISDAMESLEFQVYLPQVESDEEIQLMYRYLDANRINAAMLLGQNDNTDCNMPDPKMILKQMKLSDGACENASAFEMPPDPLICGVDVGGSDIKLVLAEGGRIRRILSYDWNPSIATEAAMILNPVYELIEMAADGRRLDGIGVAFPDIVKNNKIVDSRTSKTAGIRNNKDIDYEAEFAKISNLDDFLRPLVKDGAPVRILNDGDMAAFTVYNELSQTEAGREIAKDGIIALPIGTDIGFGWVKDDGRLAEYPGKLSGCVLRIDNDEASHFLNQEGILKAAGMPLSNPKPCIDLLVNMAEGGEQNAEMIFKNVGQYIGHAIREINYFMKPKTNKFFLMGRLVKSELVFDLMCLGMQASAPDAVVLQTDSSLAATPVMKALAEIGDEAVAQFAQAVGCIYCVL